MKREETVPLALMRAGERGVLSEVRGIHHHHGSACRTVGPRGPKRKHRGRHMLTADRGHHLEHRLRCLGFVPGAAVRVVRNNTSGPLIVAVDGSRVCLGRGVALRLMVTPSDEETKGREEPIEFGGDDPRSPGTAGDPSK